MQRSVSIEVFIDFCCPWCLIGLHHLSATVDALWDSVRVDTVFRAFELDPGAPEAGVDVQEMLMKKHGISPEQAFPPIESVARASGIPLDLRKQNKSYPTRLAHTLVRHAATKQAALQFAAALSRAYFLDGKSIVDLDALAQVGAPFGISREDIVRLAGDANELARTRDEASDSRRRGIRSVPTLLVPSVGVISASQPTEVLRQALEKGAR